MAEDLTEQEKEVDVSLNSAKREERQKRYGKTEASEDKTELRNSVLYDNGERSLKDLGKTKQTKKRIRANMNIEFQTEQSSNQESFIVKKTSNTDDLDIYSADIPDNISHLSFINSDYSSLDQHTELVMSPTLSEGNRDILSQV